MDRCHPCKQLGLGREQFDMLWIPEPDKASFVKYIVLAPVPKIDFSVGEYK